MEVLRRLTLRRQARTITIRSIRFAARLRRGSSEFATDPWQPFEDLGDELTALADALGASERERRAMVAGLEAGLRRVGLTDTTQVYVLSRISPRIMTGLPARAEDLPLRRLAV
ncbi:MAG TPA: hypothetical protein VLT59_16545 [Steroidobacteraceae bacterium]|nr:hypothetical protein [Steroidobacteraceae bacterium]